MVNKEDRIQKSESSIRKPARTFEDLIVWQKAHQFVLSVYKVTKYFPKTEIYGLISQLRRTSISIAANIAEGFKKKGKPDKVRFFNIAQGSLEECRHYMILTEDLGYGSTEKIMPLLEETSKMLERYSITISNS